MSVTSSSPPRTFRVALLGAGVISETHLVGLKQLPGISIVAVCDLDPVKGKLLQEKSGAPQLFQDLEAMLTACSPDVVHVLLPPQIHASAAETCLKAGSHIFIEKPFCPTVAECERVCAVADQAGRQIGVNHNVTFMPSVLRLIETIRSLKLGEVQNVRVVYNMPAPAFARAQHTHWMFANWQRLMLEIGPHPVSVLCRLLGKPLSAATAVSRELTLSNGSPFYQTWQSSLVLERGGGQLMMGFGGSGYMETSIHVIGEDGTAFVDLRRNTFVLTRKTRHIQSDNLHVGLGNAADLFKQSLDNFIEWGKGATGMRSPYMMQYISVKNSMADFYAALRANRAPTISGVEGTDVMAGCEMINQSAQAFLEQTQRKEALLATK